MIIGICDDDKKDTEIIEELCKECLKNDIKWDIQKFSSGEELLNYAENGDNSRIDLLFLDIEMGGISGIEVKDEVIKCDNVWRIVFVTSYKDRVYEAFGLKTLGFVNKPANKENISKWIEVVKTELGEKQYLDMAELDKSMQCAVRIEDVLYFKASGSYTELYIGSQKDTPITISKNLKYVEANTQDYPFLRIHKSYMVNMQRIENMKAQNKDKKNGVKIRDINDILPIGREYDKKAKSGYNEYVKEQMRKRM